MKCSCLSILLRNKTYSKVTSNAQLECHHRGLSKAARPRSLGGGAWCKQLASHAENENLLYVCLHLRHSLSLTDCHMTVRCRTSIFARCRKRGDTCTYPTADAEETRVEALKREISDLKSQLDKANGALMRFGDVPGDLAVHVVREAASAPDPLAAIVTAAHQISRSSRHIDRVRVDTGMQCALSPLTADLRDRFPSAYSLSSGLHDALPFWRHSFRAECSTSLVTGRLALPLI